MLKNIFFILMNYNYWVDEYSFLCSYFIVVFFLVFFLWILATNLSYNITLFEKTSQYECGFEPFGLNNIFDIQYFLIGLLYLIFDVELVLILPWIITFTNMPSKGLLAMFFFLFLFVAGLIYEWKKNVLHWT